MTTKLPFSKGSSSRSATAVNSGYIIVLLFFLFLPMMLNINIVLMREYILNESRIGLSDVVKEAKDRLKGRWMMYYLKSMGIGLLTGLAILLCAVTLIGIVLIPVVVYVSGMVQLSLAYQNEIGPTHVIKGYFKEILLLSVVLFVIVLVGGLAPLVGPILIAPALCAPNLFVALKFD